MDGAAKRATNPAERKGINAISQGGRRCDCLISHRRGNSDQLPRKLARRATLWIGLVDWVLVGLGVAIPSNVAPSLALVALDTIRAAGPAMAREKAPDAVVPLWAFFENEWIPPPD